MVNTTYTGTYTAFSGYTVTWTNASGLTVTGTLGANFNIYTPSGNAYSSLTTSGITSTPISGTVNVTYGHNWGAYGTYYTFNQAASVIGTAVSGTTIVNPALLATQLAFQNGANTVQILPVARLSSSGTSAASTADWASVFTTGVTGASQIYLSNFTGVDAFVPLYGFISSSGSNVVAYSGSVASAISAYLINQNSVGSYQRAFVGVDGTAGQVTTASLQALASGFGNSGAGTRVSLVYPASINYNPGYNTTTGLTTANFNIPGYYLAAALAGIFVGQTNVATSITNKQVLGFNYIPNQISLVDSATNYLPYGITTVRQKRDGNFWVLQGLTTNITNWVTQEISLSAIGDQLSNNVAYDLNNADLIGGPLTAITLASALSTVEGTLTAAMNSGLIQGYQNLAYTLGPPNPTTINITFQYAPTYPVNYIQVTLSLNTQTGTVISASSQSTIS